MTRSDMERLTRRIRNGKADCAYCNLEFEGEDNHCSRDCQLWQRQLERLAQYEDTGLMPGDVKDLQGLCKENGLSEYVDLIVEAKRLMDKDNERSIKQDERIERLEAENARLCAEVESLQAIIAVQGEPVCNARTTTAAELLPVAPHIAIIDWMPPPKPPEGENDDAML